MLKRLVVFLIASCLLLEQSGFAQIVQPPAIPACLAGLPLVPDRYRPVHLRALFLGNERSVELLLEPGDGARSRKEQYDITAEKLLEYFQIGLRLPDSAFWVNLRPDAQDRMIDPDLERTDIGRIMLAADVQLKKDLARFTSPDTFEGKEYWRKLYEKAESLFGQDDVEIPTVTRPWIVPGDIILGVSGNGAYVYKATLKVMLEQDWYHTSGTPAQYISAPGVGLSNHDFAGQPARLSFSAPEPDPRIKQLNEYSSRLIRELIVPKLTREVNASKRYAALRQVYYSLILAQWVKKNNCAGFSAVQIA